VVHRSHRGKISLEVALETNVAAIFAQELVLHRTVRVMTDLAALPESIVLPDEWTPLLLVALEALVARIHETGGLHTGFVDAVTIGAAYTALRDWVMVRKVKRGADVEVALVTRIGFGANDIFS
jgi:hypothetical protein